VRITVGQNNTKNWPSYDKPINQNTEWLASKTLDAWDPATILPTVHLFFTIQGIGSKWKQPTGYFLSHSTTQATVLKGLVTNAVEKLMSLALRVQVVVCDQCSTNQQMFRIFWISIDKPYSDIWCMQTLHVHYTTYADLTALCIFRQRGLFVCLPHQLRSSRKHARKPILYAVNSVSCRYAIQLASFALFTKSRRNMSF